MPNENPLKYDRTFTMKCDDQFLQALDDLRAWERPVKPRAEFIRDVIVALHQQQSAKQKTRPR